MWSSWRRDPAWLTVPRGTVLRAESRRSPTVDQSRLRGDRGAIIVGVNTYNEIVLDPPAAEAVAWVLVSAMLVISWDTLPIGVLIGRLLQHHDLSHPHLTDRELQAGFLP